MLTGGKLFVILDLHPFQELNMNDNGGASAAAVNRRVGRRSVSRNQGLRLGSLLDEIAGV